MPRASLRAWKPIRWIVVSNTYENPDSGRALESVPITFSRIGADGDSVDGITPVVDGQKLPAQVDVLRTAPDGSIRHALVSFVLPRLPAGGQVEVQWVNAPPPRPDGFRWALDRAEFDARLVLKTSGGELITSDAGEILGQDWAASDSVRVLYDGPIMKEFEIRDVPVDSHGQRDPHLDVYWRFRVFTGAESVRVAAIVERCKPRRTDYKEPIQYKFDQVELWQGARLLYREEPYDHLDQTRYRILAWKTIRVLGEGPYLENYGAIWYYTKLNEDNSFSYDKGPSTEPDAGGNWPLRQDGWGHGYTYSPSTGETRPGYLWYRYGAWVALVTALEADVPRAREAWDTMRSLAGKDGLYGYEMIPR